MKGKFLLLGSNKGDRLHYLNEACESLKNKDITPVRSSPIYETAPWGKSEQGWFLNTVLQVQTKLAPESLLKVCLEVENTLGRQRTIKWGEREIDIDILYLDQLQIQLDDLVIPHPAIPKRRFTLTPLCDLVPNEIDPIYQLTLTELLRSCPDQLQVTKTNLTLSL
ncbi:MAG: 2-amino-4-hydroxy-6-hydroxymethyldihydropteridine diphosphokinase [Cyclobacteriaceae bacterium]|nr:2-amino-4-hydroxy-6-hydroxymethyldihydropteridine diphosphokinase [Cyclobacteriaceae bacterium HetDA_MAG_MS6]